MHELSVICLTYNADLESLKETLDSIIGQKQVDLEIVIADDGSENNLKREIEQFFKKNDFSEYKLVMNPENKGIVANLFSGLLNADGEYTKTISPGDRLLTENTIRKWLDFLKNEKLNWSFSDAVYYRKDVNGLDEFIRTKAHPQDIKPYIKNEREKCRWNYVVLRDLPIGATILSKTELQREYCKRICDAGVRYAEDNMWRLLMFEGDVGGYYPEKTILYEFGSGMSTSGSEVWKERLARDWHITDKLMRETLIQDELQASMLKCLGENLSIIDKVLIKGKLRHKLNRTFKKRMSL